MPNVMDETIFLEALRAGIRRTKDLIARLTEYHGGPARTEYMMTSDLARSFVDQDFNVGVEFLNRNLVNPLIALKGARPRLLRSRRTDVVVLGNDILPLAIIEVKIGVRRLRKLKGDLDKITTTMAMIQARHAAKIFAATVFQVHVAGSPKRYEREHFEAEIEKIEKKLEAEIAIYAAEHPNFSFKMLSLQSADEGIVSRELEQVGGEAAWGRHGHATRFHAIVIRSSRPVSPLPLTIDELRRAAES